MRRGTVTGDQVRLRSSPENAEPLRHLNKGELVEVLQTWHKVRINGEEGFVSAEYVNLKPDSDIESTPAVEPSLTGTGGAPTGLGTNTATIETFRGSEFQGSQVKADMDFHTSLERINHYAQNCGVKLLITSSFRRPGDVVRGAIVVPAKRSNHIVGHAIDMNLYVGNQLYNSTALDRRAWAHLPEQAKLFFQLIRDDEVLRWGGDFAKSDPVHIDDNLSRRNPTRWMRKFDSLA